MKVIISVGAKFHAFHLAEELQKRGFLSALMTSYYDPKRNGAGYAIDPARVKTHLPSAVLTYVPHFVPALKYPFLLRMGHEVYDRWAAQHLPEGDILVAWSGWALHSIRAAKKQGMITIVERGSAHIVRQREILAEEYDKLGVKGELPSDFFVEKELQEYAEAHYISIPSTFVRRSFIEEGVPEEKLVQVPYGVSLEHFRPLPKQDDVFRVMHIGCTVRKGTHYLIQAMAELNLSNSELLLIGSPRRFLKAMIDKCEFNYRILDYVPHLDLHRIYSQSSVYVLPSIEEGLAMVQAEAMACGVPVICSTNTGGEDIIRDGVDGFVVPARDVEALREKILYLYEHEEERRMMGQSALKRAQEFTWDRYGKQIIDMYKGILAGQKGSTL